MVITENRLDKNRMMNRMAFALRHMHEKMNIG